MAEIAHAEGVVAAPESRTRRRGYWILDPVAPTEYDEPTGEVHLLEGSLSVLNVAARQFEAGCRDLRRMPLDTRERLFFVLTGSHMPPLVCQGSGLKAPPLSAASHQQNVGRGFSHLALATPLQLTEVKDL